MHMELISALFEDEFEADSSSVEAVFEDDFEVDSSSVCCRS